MTQTPSYSLVVFFFFLEDCLTCLYAHIGIVSKGVKKTIDFLTL